MSSAFLEHDDVAQTPRPTRAPTLALELRETIARWFSVRDKMQNSELILAAFADLTAEQIVANPMQTTQVEVLNGFIEKLVRGCNAASRGRCGSAPAITVTKQ